MRPARANPARLRSTARATDRRRSARRSPSDRRAGRTSAQSVRASASAWLAGRAFDGGDETPFARDADGRLACRCRRPSRWRGDTRRPRPLRRRAWRVRRRNAGCAASRKGALNGSSRMARSVAVLTRRDPDWGWACRWRTSLSSATASCGDRCTHRPRAEPRHRAARPCATVPHRYPASAPSLCTTR